jgi:hypothetical protein
MFQAAKVVLWLVKSFSGAQEPSSSNALGGGASTPINLGVLR